ncbi:MAG: hypothetical protein ACR2GY_05760 [Phycisphaerales bacterium]
MPKKWMERLIAGAALTVMLAAGLSVPRPASAQSDSRSNPIDGAVRELRAATTANAQARPLERLRALRRLNDPALEPFFTRVASEAETPLRIEAILALADLTPDNRIDASQITQLAGEGARLSLITRAVGEGLLDHDQVRQLLSSESLEAAPRVALLGSLIRDGEDVDPAALTKIIEQPVEDVIKTIASLLLAGITSDLAHLEFINQQIAALPDEAARVRARAEVARDIARYKLKRLAPWLDEAWAAAPAEWDARGPLLAAAFELDLNRALTWWKSAFLEATGYAARTRYVSLLLAAAADFDIPAATFQEMNLAAEDKHLALMQAAGIAIANQSGVLEAIKPLLDLDHDATSEIALAIVTARLSDEEQIAAFTYVIERMRTTRAPTQMAEASRNMLGAAATSHIAELDLDRAVALMVAQPDNSRSQEAMLVGLIGKQGPAFTEALTAIPRIGLSHADALALLAMAATDAPLNDEDLARLGLCASGGGQLASAERTQAAWLFIKRSGKMQDALGQLFSKN